VAFWDDYRRSLKPIEVEEPVDRFLHRPLAYVLARALLPTPISPNLVTLGSILLGVTSAVLLFRGVPWGFQLAALCLFLSAVFDCADGQLARLRKSSSALGRMLDGMADLLVIAVIVVAGAWVIWDRYAERPVYAGVWLLLVAVTVVTSSFHTAMYDHYKNVYLRMTHPAYREGEAYATALERFRARRGEPFYVRLAWPFYLFYSKRQEAYVAAFDHTSARLGELPPYDAQGAAVYRNCALPLMRVWRGWFGFGSLVFGTAVSLAFEGPEYYLLFRAVVLNAVFYGYLRPEQRRASRNAFDLIGARSGSASSSSLPAA
jgi:phosphatidylglycerophosphate synthase